jgi:two-component system, NarL family, sensor kinase
LTNIHRHSGSDRAAVQACIEGGLICLEIRDYGKGIPQGVLDNFRTSGNGVGVGLTGIRERLREVDGKLDLSSTASGTVLKVSVPAATRENQASVAAD